MGLYLYMYGMKLEKLNRLYEILDDEDEIELDNILDDDDNEYYDLDKGWDVISFLITGTTADFELDDPLDDPGAPVFKSEAPLCDFLKDKWQTDLSIGEYNWKLDPEIVNMFSNALSLISDEEIRKRCHQARLLPQEERVRLYCDYGLFDEDESDDEIVNMFSEVRSFFEQCTKKGYAVIMTMG